MKLSALCLFQLIIGQVMWCMLKYTSNPYNEIWWWMVKYLHSWHTLKSSRVTHNHLPKEIFTGICRQSFYDSTTRSLIHMKVLHVVKINYFCEVLLSEWNTCLRNLIILHPKKTTQHSLKSTQYTFKHCTKIFECFKDGRIIWFCMRGS